MKKELNEFTYEDGEVFVGFTKAGTMVYDEGQPAWVFTLAVDGAEPVSYDDDLDLALDELRDDLLSEDYWTFEHDGEEYHAEFDDPDGMVLRFTDSQDNFLGTLSAGTMPPICTASAFRRLLALHGSSRENKFLNSILSWRMRWPLKQTWR